MILQVTPRCPLNLVSFSSSISVLFVRMNADNIQRSLFKCRMPNNKEIFISSSIPPWFLRLLGFFMQLNRLGQTANLQSTRPHWNPFASAHDVWMSSSLIFCSGGMGKQVTNYRLVIDSFKWSMRYVTEERNMLAGFVWKLDCSTVIVKFSTSVCTSLIFTLPCFRIPSVNHINVCTVCLIPFLSSIFLLINCQMHLIKFTVGSPI